MKIHLSYDIRLTLVMLSICCLMTACQRSAPNKPLDSVVHTEWPQYGRDHGGQRFSDMTQINRDNVHTLEVAWVHQAGELDAIENGEQPFNPWQATPLLLDNTLISCTPSGRVIALDPVTGEQRWSFDPDVTFSSFGHSFVKCRGVSSFIDTDKKDKELCKRRIVWGTADLRAFALDASTGQRCTDFGANHGTPGEVQFDAGGPLDFQDEVQIHAPPAMVGHVAVFGSTLADMLRVEAPSGMVRAIDARSGELLWTFDPVPRDANDPASNSWADNSNFHVGAGNAWSLLSADPVNKLIFVPTSSPSADLVGNYRVGDNRYTDSLVALAADTGEVVWHFQFVHHDLWDYDLPAQPILTNITHNGETLPAVIQLTKQGMVFVFNRLTGEPLFPIEERAVAQGSEIPGEVLSPTQPFSGIPPLVDHHLTEDDMWGFTFWDRNACVDALNSYRNDGIYTPPSVKGSVRMPASAGGMNWGGGAVDSDHGILVVPTLHMPQIHRLIPRSTHDPANASPFLFPMEGTDYLAEFAFLVSPLGAPCTEPPWGRLSAIDLSTGELLWQQPLGSIERLAKQTVGIPVPLEWGTPMAGGPITTAGGLTFIAATADDKFRAFDTLSGEKLWEVRLPAGGQATPMTYAINNSQYVVIVAGGHPYYGTTKGDHIIAYRISGKHTNSQ
ncbi:MAG: pyrroloquinoline quinone-dependent dehydrogenase [Pseudomonadota bacterium]